MSYRCPPWLAFLAALAVSACGGGGDTPPPAGGPPASAPVAVDDTATTVAGQPVTIPVLANDTDPDGADDIDPATVQVSGVTHGTATVNTVNGDVTYAPEDGFIGSAGFIYFVSDRAGNRSQPAQVSITVQAPTANGAPIAQPASFTTDEDTVLDGALAASDPDGDALTYRAVSQPAHGSLTVEASGQFTYAPAPNFAGEDGFSFVANDGALDSEPAAVTITVVDQPEPQLDVADPAPVPEDAGAVEFQVTLSRAPDAPVTVHYATADGSAVAGADYAATSGELQFTPDGATTQVVTVPVTDDAFDENDESFALILTVTAGADGVEAGKLEATATIVDNDTSELLRVGAALRSVKPSQPHIDGVTEARLGGSERTQKFNLGGFGINPTQSLPDPADQLGEALTQPAEIAAFSGSRGEEPIHLRAMVVEDAGGEAVIFVMLDAIGAGNVIQQGVKAAVTAATGIPAEHILFGQTHSHAGPDLQGLWGGVPEDWIHNTLYPAAFAAAAEAWTTRRPARLTLAQGLTSEFNNYRRPRIDPNADADSTLTLLRATADDGTPVGAILQYNAHPTSIDENPRAVHADYIQGAMDWVEAHVGGVGLYYNGPIADASGSGERAGCVKDPADGDYGNVRCRGEGIAAAALAFTERELAPTLAARSVEVVLPITNPGFLAFGALGSFNRYYNFMQQVPVESIPGIGPEAKNLPQLTPTATTLVSRVTLGGADAGLEIVTIPGEATNTFGQYIRGLARTNVMLLGLTHNSFGYIVPEEEFSYVDQEGDNGLVAPFTGYEENVSLGPLTAPLLRTQGYNPLFEMGPQQDIPPTLMECFRNTESAACIVQVLENRLDALVNGVSACIEGGLGANGCPLRTALDMTVGAIADGCREFGGPEEFCAIFDAVTGTGTGEAIPDLDVVLVEQAALAQTAGCDPLDPANCLYPFPNDWFTAAAAPGSIQSEARGGTGRRVNIHTAATPRNSAGKPVDPTEWNRSDGFSPGALVTTFVPSLSLEQTFGLPSHELGVANLALSQRDDAPILVFEVQDDGSAPVKHLVWSEIDQNANLLTVVGVPNAGTFPVDGVTNEYAHLQRPFNDGRAALLIRPAKNFAEGKRYVVVLRNLKDRYGNAIRPQNGFKACLNGGSTLPPIQGRCDQLAEHVFPVLDDAGIALDDSVFLAWDFTIESTESAIGRLRHIRDDAFSTLSANPLAEDCTQLTAANAATCAAPEVAITGVTENPQGGIRRRIQGTITVPNYLAPVGPSPLDDPNIHSALNQFCANAPEGEFADNCAEFRDIADLGQGAALPSRLFYSPADGTPAPDANNPLDPTGLRYGDGLPDRNGTMTARFLCQIPAQATPDTPARASLYGHGQLDRATAITYEGTPDVAREHNYMFCAVDWFGFRTGDAANVLSALVDMSNFPVIPDASQQGMLNFMFLARAMAHPQGFAAIPEFQDDASGRPVFDRSEIFYNGNSQGGIFGGVVLAASKDVNRGVLGSLGMNYSTLLTRSKNFDEYAGLLYNSYTDPLDRQLLFSMMQMLWDRSENNAYASHLVDNSAFGGPTNVVKLDPMFGDPQVTMFSAEVMARTMGVPFDDRQTLHVETLGAEYLGVNGRRHPGVAPYEGLAPLAYGTDAVKGSALMVWDTNHAGAYSHIPPITNTPPRTGPDNHDASQKAKYGRCQMAHFLRTGGELIDILPVQFGGQPCPAVPPAQPTTGGGTPPADQDGDGVPDDVDQCPTEPGPASNNGCPEQGGGGEGFPIRFSELCDPLFNAGCLSDIPGTDVVQEALDTAWNAVMDGGEPPSGVLPDQCDPVTGDNCLSDLPPPVGDLFGEPGGGNEPPDTAGLTQIATGAVANAATLPTDLAASAGQTAANAANGTLAQRDAEVVVMEGRSFPDWSQPAAAGVAKPYPSGVREEGGGIDPFSSMAPYLCDFASNDPSGVFHCGARDAHNGYILYPPNWEQDRTPFSVPTAVPVGEIVAFRRENSAWVEIPVQVDERMPYFLANAGSTFSTYSGTDPEVSYVWDRELWKATGECAIDPLSVVATPDPIANLDDDDEIAFMASDAGEPASPIVPAPEGTTGPGQEIALSDPLNPGAPRFVYLFRRPGGPSFGPGHYVEYVRDANADQFVDQTFWAESDPEKIGTENEGYGPNIPGTVCGDNVRTAVDEGNAPRPSSDRFPRDGVTVRSDKYQVYASGRWMIRSVQIAKPGQPGVYGADIVDRWKGRAFQQSPGSIIDIVGFEDEQVNWEANAALLGERVGPVRAIREVWGADSGTNVTKTETYYRDAYAYRYRVRVHPIPPDGLYTSWDYNRDAMVSDDPDVPGGRYYTAVRATGVPIDGVNDDVTQIDYVPSVNGMCITADGPRDASEYGGTCPLYFDMADPALNLPLAIYNWEQVSAKGDLGSLVYLFELKNANGAPNAVAVPYYRDDACFDDATGDDPVRRPWPGEKSTDARVRNGYVAAAGGTPYEQLRCEQKQGAHAQHGLHFFAPPESDNAFAPVTVNELDGQQWAFPVSTERPQNVGEPYANVVRAPLQRTVRPRPSVTDVAGDGTVPYDYASCVAMAQQGGDAQQEAATKFSCAVIFGGGRTEGEGAESEIQGPNTYVAMDDGTLIATNVYIPWACNVAKNPNARKCPSILEMSGYESGSDEGRTPAGDFDDIVNPDPDSDQLPLTGGTRAAHDTFYKSGDRYVSVVASVRGTGCSAGEFDLFSRKSAYDGYQLVEWMAQQHWSNGKVGVFGHSYSGITGAMIASTSPPSLKMVSISGQIGDVYRDITYPGGVSNYGFPLLWTGGVRPAYDYLGGTFAGLIADSQDRQCLRNQAERSRTVEDEPLIQGLSDVDGPWFQERSVVNFLKNVKAPTQIVTAYQDEQTGPRGGTHVFDALPQDLTRRLVMLNGDHGSQTGPAEVVAERKFWIDHIMLGANDPAPRPWSPGNALPAPDILDASGKFRNDGRATSRVLLEITRDTANRSNGHIDSSGFPLAQTQWTDFYFQVDGTLDTARSSIAHGETGSGSTYFSGSKRQFYSYQAGTGTGAEVSTADAAGADELIFVLDVDTVAQGAAAWVIAGPITADLWITSTGTDTELMVQLIDADPATGERLYLQRGVLRASHREILAERSQCAALPAGGRITDRACTDLDHLYRPFRPHVNPRDIVPGQATRYRLEIFPVGHVLRAGHQLLVKVHAPSLDDNDWAYITKAPPALNTLHHSAEYASSIRLPVIPLSEVSDLGGPTGTCADASMRCVIAGGVQDPSADYRSECWNYGEQFEGPDGVFTNLVCGTFDAIASALFGSGGGGEPGPGSAIGEQTGPVLDAAAETYQGLIGSAESNGRVQAGVGVVDMTPDVGYGAGQYSPANTAAAGGATGGDVDPYVGGKKQEPAYGVQSRLTGRALVIEGANGKRIALLKSDNYLAQDHLVRRIGQILADKGSSIGYDQILYGVTHAHSSTYLSSPSAGVWVFQDAFDARFFEFQARKLAEAILIAERGEVVDGVLVGGLRPARMGATTVHHRIYKGNVVRPHRADDNTPAGYPREFGDHGLVVMRFDTDEAEPKPLAVWINWGQHPEGLDGYSLHSPDYVGPLERFVDRELGAPLIFSQGDVGSAENSGNTSQFIRDDGSVCAGPGATPGGCPAGQGVKRDWQHAGHAQGERGARFLADAVVKGWKVIGGEQPPDGPVDGPRPNNYVPSVQVPMSNSFPVDYRNAWVPGPLSHPYPGVSACRTETTAEGNPGVPNAADCAHAQEPDSETQMYWQTLKAHGIPVPENYDLPAFGTVEENLRLRLQAFRVGDVVLGSSASEAQVDLILNFESRANDVEGDIYDGFDWACLMDGFKDDPKYAAACALQKQYFDPAEFHWDLALHGGATNRDPAAIARMRAQVHNPADGWDAPEYVAYANSEPADISQIKGNFTKEELSAERGYKLAVGIGHAGDYNGYTVSYREYMAYDDYRKALTSYGAHTADYMVTRMVRMAGAMKGGPELAPEPHDTMAQADEARQLAASTALGRITAAAYDSFLAALPPDVGPAEALTQPQGIGWFEAATFSWRGGSTAVDNPHVVIERCDGGTGAACTGGTWQLFGDQQGEVQTRVQPPQGAEGLAATYGGQQEWLWTANFEAFDGFPARLGSTPAGVYRFVVEGCINDFSAPAASFTSRITGFLSGMLPDALASQAFQPAACRSGGTPYGFASTGFEVEPGAHRVESLVSDGNGNLTIGVAARSIPQTYESDFRFVNAGDDFGSYCKECSFRPWAYSTAAPVSVALVVDGVTYPVAGSGTTWTASVGAEGGRSASITVTYADGRISRPFRVTLTGAPQTIGGVDAPPPAPEEPPSDAPQLCAPGQIPEIGGECLADNGGEPVQDVVDEAYGALTGGL
jgi:predicted acyl esterase